jgi:zinc/manganese transport system substrate-binding protein
MNRKPVALGCFLLAARGPLLAGGALSVVATTADFGAIAREIGGDAVRVAVLAHPAEDAHFVVPKPSSIALLARADVLIEGGAELEIGWLPPLLDGARNRKLAEDAPGRVACAEGLTLLEVPATLDRAKGDIHAKGNPHFMTDPVNARQVAGRICGALAAADPAHAEQFAQRLAAFTNRLDASLAAWQRRLEPFRGQRVVAYHNSWPYFAERFGLKIDLFLEPKPGIPPSPAHLAEVVARMKAEHIAAVIVEPHEDCRAAETIAARTDAKVLAFTQYPGGVKGTEAGYIAMMDYLVETLASALQESRPRKEPGS